jgi:predicted RNase H-like HicB family nuclease
LTLIWRYEARSALGRLRSSDPTKAKIVMAIARNLTSDPYPDDSSQLGTSAFWLLRRWLDAQADQGAAMRGYIVVIEGDDETGYSACSPDLPGVVAAGETREETELLMVGAMAEHLAVLRDLGRPVPEPAEAVSVAILDPAAA